MRIALGRRLAPAGLALLLAACTAPVARVGPADIEPPEARIDARLLATRVALYQDDYLRNYVDAVGRRLLSVGPRTERLLSFAILDRGEPLLLATADDRVYLSRGLLALLQSEDELAGLLAHGIAHLLAGHSERSDQTANATPPWLRAAGLAGVLAADLRQAAGITPFDALRLPLAPFTDREEQAVDGPALRRVAAAGYDPAAFAGLLRRAQRVAALLPDWSAAGCLQRHRFSSERVTALRAGAAGLPWVPARPFAASREALLKRLDGLYWGSGNPQQGLFVGQRFLQPDMGIELEVPAGWTPVNTPRFVAAVEPDGEAVMQLSTAEPPADPAQHASEFLQRLQRETGLDAASDQAFTAGSWPGRLLRIDDSAAGSPLTACYAWVQAGGTTFRLIGAGRAQHAETFCAAVQRLQPLPPAARKEIRAQRVRVVEALAGERLAELGERSGNLWSPAITAAINDLDEQAPLSAGEPVRILRAEPYY